jgi:hypothetical protein
MSSDLQDLSTSLSVLESPKTYDGSLYVVLYVVQHFPVPPIEAPQPALSIAVPRRHDCTIVGSMQGTTPEAPARDQVYQVTEAYT